ncbi:MAG TPA: hypothetical protein PKX20_09465, partial [Methanothrix soehngenii]|nr:hypothetical protein [Methanothrix soehngenii]
FYHIILCISFSAAEPRRALICDSHQIAPSDQIRHPRKPEAVDFSARQRFDLMINYRAISSKITKRFIT